MSALWSFPVFVLAAGFFIGCLAIVWWTLYVDHGNPEDGERGGGWPADDEAAARLMKKKKRRAAKPGSKPLLPKGKPRPVAEEKDFVESPMLVKELKGHVGPVIAVAFSHDGRFVATASEDSTVRVIFMDSLEESSPRYMRVSLERDHVTALAFSENSRRLVCVSAKSRSILFYSVPSKKEAGKGVKLDLVKQFPSGHDRPVTHILLLDSDKWMVVVTCACGSEETAIRFHNPRGDSLATLDTNQLTNHAIAASKDNRFLAVGAGMPEVKVLEVTRNKTGEFQQVSRAMVLTGHKKAVLGVAMNDDATRAVTASTDGSWRVWDTSVRYNLDEEPRLLADHTSSDRINSNYSGAALGREGTVVALTSGRHIFFFDVASGHQVESVGVAHASSGGGITSVVASPDGQLLATTADGDRHARVWRFPSA